MKQFGRKLPELRAFAFAFQLKEWKTREIISSISMLTTLYIRLIPSFWDGLIGSWMLNNVFLLHFYQGTVLPYLLNKIKK